MTIGTGTYACCFGRNKQYWLLLQEILLPSLPPPLAGSWHISLAPIVLYDKIEHTNEDLNVDVFVVGL
jgi:hypothetical protein